MEFEVGPEQQHYDSNLEEANSELNDSEGKRESLAGEEGEADRSQIEDRPQETSAEAIFEDYKRMGRELETSIFQLAKDRVARQTECAALRRELALTSQKVELQKKLFLEMQMKMENLSTARFNAQNENQRDVAQKFGYVTDLLNSIGETGEHLNAKFVNLKQAEHSFSAECSNTVSALKIFLKDSQTAGREYINNMKEVVNYFKKCTEGMYEKHSAFDEKLESKIQKYRQMLEFKQKNAQILEVSRNKLNNLQDEISLIEKHLDQSQNELESAKTQAEKLKETYNENISQMKTILLESQAELETMSSNRGYLKDQLETEQHIIKSLNESILDQEDYLKKKCAEKNLLKSELEELNALTSKAQEELQSVHDERERLIEVESQLIMLTQKEEEMNQMITDIRSLLKVITNELELLKEELNEKENQLETKQFELRNMQEEFVKLEQEEKSAQASVNENLQINETLKNETFQETQFLQKEIEQEKIILQKNESEQRELITELEENTNKLTCTVNEVEFLKKEVETAIERKESIAEKIHQNESRHMQDLDNLQYLLNEASDEYLEMLNRNEFKTSPGEAANTLKRVIEQKKKCLQLYENQIKETNISFHDQMSLLNRKDEQIKMAAEGKMLQKTKQMKTIQENMSQLNEKKDSEKKKIEKNIPRLTKIILAGIQQLELILTVYKETWRKRRSTNKPSIVILQNCTRLEEFLQDPMLNIGLRFGVQNLDAPNPDFYNELFSKFKEDFKRILYTQYKNNAVDINKELVELGICIYQKGGSTETNDIASTIV